MENDLLKRIESLEKELQALKKDNLAMFGRTYSQLGDTKSDLVLNTRGQVKIRWGNKFIDLIKNGEINVDTDIIFTASESLGSKNGIYILDNGSVYLKYKDKEINLVGEIGTTYVSFQDDQETTSDEKLKALHNIGFYCESLDSLGESSIQNGLVYIEADQSLYIVKDGVGTKLMQIIQDTVNSILEESKKEQNEEQEEIELPFKIVENRILFNYNLFLNDARSTDAVKNESGFLLYKQDDRYILEIDDLIVRNRLDSRPHIDPKSWNNLTNFITSAEIIDFEKEDLGDEENSEEIPKDFDITDVNIELELLFPNIYSEDSIIYAYSYFTESGQNSTPFKLPLKIVKIKNEILTVNIDFSTFKEIIETPKLEEPEDEEEEDIPEGIAEEEEESGELPSEEDIINRVASCVDNLVNAMVRNSSSNSEIDFKPQMDPRYWDATNNVIIEVESDEIAPPKNTVYQITQDSPGVFTHRWMQSLVDIPAKIKLQFYNRYHLWGSYWAYTYYNDEETGLPTTPFKVLMFQTGYDDEWSYVNFEYGLDAVRTFPLEELPQSFYGNEPNREEVMNKMDQFNAIFRARAKQAIDNLVNAITSREPVSSTEVDGLIILASYAPEDSYFNRVWKICDGTNGTIDLSDRFVRDENEEIIAAYYTR